MPKIKRHPPSKLWHEHERERLAASEKNDCSVKALSVVTGLPYSQCKAALDEAGRKPKDGAYHWQMEKAAELLGYRMVPLPHTWMRDMIASYPGAHKNLRHVTTHHPRRFRKQWRDVEPLIVHTSHHYASFKDGQIHDWTINKAIRVISLFRLELIGAEAPPPVICLKPGEQPPWHDPAAVGRLDYQRGHTACPFGAGTEKEKLWRAAWKEEKERESAS